jgi:hypothetical protein
VSFCIVQTLTAMKSCRPERISATTDAPVRLGVGACPRRQLQKARIP